MKLGHRTTTAMEPGIFRRPDIGVTWTDSKLGLPLQNLSAWESKTSPAGASRPLRHALHVTPPKVEGTVTRIHILGIFGMDADELSSGELGATLILGKDEDPIARFDLINGRHFANASDLNPLHRLTGDGASIETVGEADIEGGRYRVDMLTLDVDPGTELMPIRFRDVSNSGRFLVFDVFYEIVPVGTCPFKNRSGGVALSELAAVIRVGDRVTLRRALDQLENAILSTRDLDEAKGEALTFIAVVTAATIEMGSRAMHRVQLQAARTLDALTTPEEIVAEARCIIEGISQPLSNGVGSPSAALIDKALAILSRNFAKDINDTTIADQLGLSTSHFRYLFKEVTGQPFHKYLIALRLERARKLLLEANMPVSEVAAAVGFNGLAHFSRAFAQRFSVSPTNLRRSAPSLTE